MTRTEPDSTPLGKPLTRTDGPLKVTGAAKYTADLPVAGVAHAVLLQSTVTKGKITGFDATEAERVPGFVALLTHENAPALRPAPKDMQKGMPGEKLTPLSGATIYYNGQDIGVLVAETIEAARQAADLVRVTYDTAHPFLGILEPGVPTFLPKSQFGQPCQSTRGDVEQALRGGQAHVDQTYSTPMEHHNPMEPHATLALWSGGKLTVYDSTQGVDGVRGLLAETFGLPPDDVRAVCHFTGGGFGCKGFVWAHVVLAALAARQVGRPVKLVVERPQMFTNNGHRAPTVQRLRLSAGADGTLLGIRHDTLTHTSEVDDFTETAGFITKMLYAVPAVQVSHRLARVNFGTPTPMRAPGESVGTYALECAMDELAYELGMDPVELRLKNHADKDPENGKPWSSKFLKDCYARGAEVFGWKGRPLRPGTMRDGRHLVGWGMATATYPALSSPAQAKARLFADGHAVVSSGTQDIGTGTYTVQTQVAAEALGLPVERVRFELGDTKLPKAPVSGGSQTTASVGPAVHAACSAVRAKALALAVKDPRSPLHGAAVDGIRTENGRCFVDGASSKGETYGEILGRAGLVSVDADSKSKNDAMAKRAEPDREADASCRTAPTVDCYSTHSFGAQFCEVRVDEDTGEVRVSRFVGAFDAGRILNPRTGRNQLMGGILWGLGMALMEETAFDPNLGRLVTRNLADYRVPVAADLPALEIVLVDEPDYRFNALGARGIGEIGITGTAAAVANAVFHATGKRIRDLPISPEKVLG